MPPRIVIPKYKTRRGEKLTVDVLPESSWYRNCRSLAPEKWDVARKISYQLAGYACEICGGRGKGHPVECHEVWTFDFPEETQRLTDLIALCPLCHKVKHLGLAIHQGKGRAAKNHLMKINDWDRAQTSEYLQKVVEEAFMRDMAVLYWQIDIAYLDSYIEEHTRKENDDT